MNINTMNYKMQSKRISQHSIQKRVEKKADDCKAVFQWNLKNLQFRITEIDKYIQGLFDTKVRGEIYVSLFASLKRTYVEEKEQLKSLVAELIGKLYEKNEAVNTVNFYGYCNISGCI